MRSDTKKTSSSFPKMIVCLNTEGTFFLKDDPTWLRRQLFVVIFLTISLFFLVCIKDTKGGVSKFVEVCGSFPDGGFLRQKQSRN